MPARNVSSTETMAGCAKTNGTVYEVALQGEPKEFNIWWDTATIQGRFPLENICVFSSPSKEDGGKHSRNYLLSLHSEGDRFL